MTDWATVVGRARYLHVDFSNDAVDADMTIYGPFVAMDFRC